MPKAPYSPIVDLTNEALRAWGKTHHFTQVIYIKPWGMFFARFGPYSGGGFTVEMALMNFRKESR
jgi:hypothetical protein